MEMNMNELHAFQLLHFFVTKHGYQIVTIKQQRKDIWLMNPASNAYPIIRLSTSNNADTLQQIEYLRQVHRAIMDMVKREGKLFILNTNPESTPMDNEFLTQSVIAPKHCGDEMLKGIFPGIEDIPHDVEDIQKEYIKITHSLEEAQMNLIRKQRKQMGFFKQIPKLTGIIMAICVVVWLLAFITAYYLESDVLSAILWGANYKMNVVSMHEYWRFITAGFLHLDIFHLIMNMMALLNVGIACEKAFNKKQYLIILLVSIITGNLFVFLTEGNTIGLGISGGIFGLLGAFIATLFENGSIKHPMVRSTVIRLLMLNLLISLMPGISLFAHLGGFISGCFMGVIFVNSKRWAPLKKHVTICLAILLGFTCGMATKVTTVAPLQKVVDSTLLSTVRALGFNAYADYMQSCYLNYYTEEELGL